MAEKDSDLQKMEELIELMKKNDLAEVEICHGEDKYHLKRTAPAPQIVGQMPYPHLPAGQGHGPTLVQHGVPVEEPQSDLIDITSPIVGTFYAQPSPDAEPYVEVGTMVEPEMVICIVEAMKVMNEIKAEVSGTITEVCVSSGQAVEYGQVLYKVKP